MLLLGVMKNFATESAIEVRIGEKGPARKKA